MADDLEGWAAALLLDFRGETTQPLAHDWQKRHGRLVAGSRLVPKIPFFTGGEYVAENVFALDSVKGMELRAEIWRQTRHLPDGTRVRFDVVD